MRYTFLLCRKKGTEIAIKEDSRCGQSSPRCGSTDMIMKENGRDVVKGEDGWKEEGSAWESAQASEPWRQVCGEGNSDQGGIFFLFWPSPN